MLSRSLTVNFLKWSETIKICWSRHTAYRLNFFLQVIGPSLVFFFIKYNLWSSVFGGDQTVVLGGFTLKQMIQYHVWSMVIGLISYGHNSMNLSEDIRLGRISSYLIYPFNFWEFHTSSFISFQLIQTFIAIVTVLIILPFGWIDMPSIWILFKTLLFCFFVSNFWYVLQYFIGLLSFWLEETWIIRVLINMVAVFFSGAILPLEFFPPLVTKLISWTPLPYLNYYPIKMLTGNEIDLLTGYGIIGFWTVMFMGLNHLVWKRGMRLYTAAGM